MNAEAIEYKPSFASNVGGQLYAKFVPRANGDPDYKVVDERSDLREYAITLHLRSPHRDEIDHVEYYFDHPEFRDDPLGLSDDKGDDFREVIRSYGDVGVDVKVFIGGRVFTQRVKLSQMLANGHAAHTKPSIIDAINRIRAN